MVEFWGLAKAELAAARAAARGGAREAEAALDAKDAALRARTPPRSLAALLSLPRPHPHPTPHPISRARPQAQVQRVKALQQEQAAALAAVQLDKLAALQDAAALADRRLDDVMCAVQQPHPSLSVALARSLTRASSLPPPPFPILSHNRAFHQTR